MEQEKEDVKNTEVTAESTAGQGEGQASDTVMAVL